MSEDQGPGTDGRAVAGGDGQRVDLIHDSHRVVAVATQHDALIFCRLCGLVVGTRPWERGTRPTGAGERPCEARP